MNEKRFKLSKYVTPSSVSYFCDENGKMLNKEVVKVLNELNDENEQLQKEVKNRSAFIIDKGLGDTFVRWKNDRKSQIREV